eukprot:775664-Pyramimonas_sp.AAC.1
MEQGSFSPGLHYVLMGTVSIHKKGTQEEGNANSWSGIPQGRPLSVGCRPSAESIVNIPTEGIIPNQRTAESGKAAAAARTAAAAEAAAAKASAKGAAKATAANHKGSSRPVSGRPVSGRPVSGTEGIYL